MAITRYPLLLVLLSELAPEALVGSAPAEDGTFGRLSTEMVKIWWHLMARILWWNHMVEEFWTKPRIVEWWWDLWSNYCINYIYTYVYIYIYVCIYIYSKTQLTRYNMLLNMAKVVDACWWGRGSISRFKLKSSLCSSCNDLLPKYQLNIAMGNIHV
jgi:hypothetical protein